MRKLLIGVSLLSLAVSGCALPLPGLTPSVSGGSQQDIKTTTDVRLSEQNFRILKTNVVGSDWGINFLGVIPIVSPDYTKAVAKLYKEARITEGRPQAIVNVLQQHTSPYFILFSLPRITFRADLVEFVPATQPQAVPRP